MTSRPAAPVMPPGTLPRAYGLMRARYGHQRWWPGDSPFEICIGAILTQNTSWKNVERALHQLKAARALAPEPLQAMPLARLAGLLRPAGCHTVKARRVRAFVDLLVTECQGSLAQLFAGDTETVRSRLLAIPGIGPETADSMLLYAGGHLSFVVDAYLRRILARHGWIAPEIRYPVLRALGGAQLSGPGTEGWDLLDLWQDFHAQVVAVGKICCKARAALCQQCPLAPLLPADGPHGMAGGR